MTTGTKIFRSIICVLLGLTMLLGVFFAFAFILHIDRDFIEAEYGITIAGVEVT